MPGDVYLFSTCVRAVQMASDLVEHGLAHRAYRRVSHPMTTSVFRGNSVATGSAADSFPNAVPAAYPVVPSARVKAVFPCAAVESVGTGAADQSVRAGVALEQVIAEASTQAITFDAATKDVVPTATVE